VMMESRVVLTSVADDGSKRLEAVETTEARPAPRSHGCNCLKTVVFWRCGVVHGGKTHESLKPGPEPMGIITWKHELLVVPFTGQWAA